MNDAQTEVLLEWYRGEILGEAIFSTLAVASREDTAQAEKWLLLRDLERHVQQQIRLVLESHGITLPARESNWVKGEAWAAPLVGTPWFTLMEQMIPVAEQSLCEMRLSASILPKELQALASFVVRHEQALLDFMTCEADGQPCQSAIPITRAMAEYPSRPG